MDVRSAKIGVDEEDTLTSLRHGPAQIGAQGGLPLTGPTALVMM